MKIIQTVIGFAALIALIAFIWFTITGFNTNPKDYDGAGYCTNSGDCY